jgi:acetyl-CoA/propionyl-CoA carboxylase carboxyl transferase subunit
MTALATRPHVTGPDVVRSVTGEDTDMEALGGPSAHGKRSGVVHVVADSEADAFYRARRITGTLSQPGIFDVRSHGEPTDLGALLPEQRKRAYDVRPLVRAVLDDDPNDPHGAAFEELQPKWAPNMVIGSAGSAGAPSGCWRTTAAQGGCLDSISAEKASRFVRMCDSFGVPLLVLVDVPGYLPGSARNGTAWCDGGRSCCTRSPRQWCPG